MYESVFFTHEIHRCIAKLLSHVTYTLAMSHAILILTLTDIHQIFVCLLNVCIYIWDLHTKDISSCYEYTHWSDIYINQPFHICLRHVKLILSRTDRYINLIFKHQDHHFSSICVQIKLILTKMNYVAYLCVTSHVIMPHADRDINLTFRCKNVSFGHTYTHQFVVYQNESFHICMSYITCDYATRRLINQFDFYMKRCTIRTYIYTSIWRVWKRIMSHMHELNIYHKWLCHTQIDKSIWRFHVNIPHLDIPVHINLTCV